MNCQNFETVVNDLAREQMMEASAQEEALRHSDECQMCAARLNEERALTRSLNEFSSAMRGVIISSQVEHFLLDEFRQQRTNGKEVPRRIRRWFPLYAAAAAALVFGFAVVVYQAFIGKESQPGVSSPRISHPVQPPPAPDTAVTTAPVLASVPNTVKTSSPVSRRTRQAKKQQPKPINNSEMIAANLSDAEVVSEFIPIGYTINANVEEGAQLVRVEMPRSAMARFGMPVNMERYNERVKADVLVSADGLPRAIRFVQ